MTFWHGNSMFALLKGSAMALTSFVPSGALSKQGLLKFAGLSFAPALAAGVLFGVFLVTHRNGSGDSTSRRAFIYGCTD